MEYRHLNPLNRNQQYTSKGFIETKKPVEVEPKLEDNADSTLQPEVASETNE